VVGALVILSTGELVEEIVGAIVKDETGANVGAVVTEVVGALVILSTGEEVREIVGAAVKDTAGAKV
jgi:hypothetical protein